ncbi:MAG: hypothetical protein ABSG68_24465, partial [Thermoguttaceae bacterium]
LMLCRLCEPSSELHISEHIYAHSALADLLGIPPEKINEQRHLVAQVQFLATHELVARGHIALGDHEFLGPAGKRVFIKAHQRVLLVQQFPGAGAVTETRTGTFVNGRRVRSAEIHPGDILAVGRSEFVVRFEPVSAAFAMAAGHAGACR